MSIVGIVAEYNPFHNGHKYHIEEAKRLSGCKHAVIVMSGDFVQRGECAIIDKYERARAALMNGADAVIELPVHYSSAGAELFGRGSVQTLAAAGIDALSFGCENDDMDLFSSIASILKDEPYNYKLDLKKNLKEGMTFPAAVSKALSMYIGDPVAESIISQPNNMLAIYYLKALPSGIRPIPVKRIGSGYNDVSMGDAFPSAAAIRKEIRENKNVYKYIPDNESISYPMITSDFSQMFSEKLLEKDFTIYADIDEALSNRINNMKDSYKDIVSFTKQLKTRNYTFSRISRALIHILNDITDGDMAALERSLPFIKILGFRKDSDIVLSNIIRNSPVPVITKLKNAENQLDAEAYSLFIKTFNASARYRICRNIKYNINDINEHKKGLVII